jgi:NAD(P)-dependent dehydrogenase (short-subunit alcohol dehydrogenase family)
MILKGKTILITGANSGIGKVTATELAKLGANIVMVCRNEEKAKAVQEDINALTGLNNIDLYIADMSSHSSIKKFADAFYKKHNSLDVLINNAGAIANKRTENEDGIEMTMATNHLGYFLTTHYMLPALKQASNARIVNVASLAHRFTSYTPTNLNAEQNYNYFRQYCLSKLCNILFTKQLSEALKNTANITANSLHPGNISSNFGKTGTPFFKFVMKNFGFVLTSPEKGAQTSIYLASSPEVQDKTGLYWYKKNPVIPSLDAINTDNANHLWEWSLKKTGIKEYF